MFNNDSLRLRWQFVVPASELLAGAEAQLKHHYERLAYYQHLVEELKQELPANVVVTGTVLDDLVVSSARYGAPTPSLQIAPELQRRFSEAGSKVQEHSRLVRYYEEWVSVLSKAEARQAESLECTLDDLKFFGLAGRAGATDVAEADAPVEHWPGDESLPG